MKKNISIVLNILIIIFEIIGLIQSYNINGLSLLKYYTEISSILALITSIIYVGYMLKFKKESIWLGNIRFLATTSLTLTFLVVIFILTPLMNEISFFELMFGPSVLYHHTLCPIITIISFIYFEQYNNSKQNIHIANLLTVLYGIIMTMLNILKLTTGPYPFLLVYKQPIYMSIIWFISINAGSYLISILIKKIKLKKIN